MNEKYLEKQLKTLQYVRASDGLKDRIHNLTSDLPSHQKAFFPLVAFQMGVAMAVVLVLLLAGSGVVAAAKYSRPGSFFYPVKKIINTLPVHVFKEDDDSSLTPAPIPQGDLLHSSGAPTPETKKEHLQQNLREQENKGEKQEQGDELHEVEGLSTHNPVISVVPQVHNNEDSNHENEGKFNFGQRIRDFFEHAHSSSSHHEQKDN